MKKISQVILSNVSWNLLTQLLMMAVQFIVVIVVAKILKPDDFGTFSVAMIFINFILIIQDMGLGEALVQRKEEIDRASSVIFFNSLCLGLIWFFAILATSFLVANYFNKKELGPILNILGFYFLISPFYTTQRSLLRKELNFRKIFFLSMVSSVISGIVTVFLAFVIRNIWVLILGFLIEPLVMLIAVWRFVSWRPVFKYNIKLAKATFRFGGLVSLTSFMWWILANIDIFFIAKFLGFSSTGVYSLGFKIATLPYFSIAYPVSLVLYPIFCKLQDDSNLVKEYYFQYLYWLPFISFGVGIVIICTSYSFVYFVLGSKWLEAITVIRIISVASILGSVVGINSQIYRALNRPDLDMKITFAKMCIFVPCFYVAARYNLAFFCFVYLITSILFIGINIIVCLNIIKLSFKSLISELKPTINVAFFTCLWLFLAYRIYPNLFLDAKKINLVIMPLIVISIYLVSTRVVDRNRFMKIKVILIQLFNSTG